VDLVCFVWFFLWFFVLYSSSKFPVSKDKHAFVSATAYCHQKQTAPPPPPPPPFWLWHLMISCLMADFWHQNHRNSLWFEAFLVKQSNPFEGFAHFLLLLLQPASIFSAFWWFVHEHLMGMSRAEATVSCLVASLLLWASAINGLLSPKGVNYEG